MESIKKGDVDLLSRVDARHAAPSDQQYEDYKYERSSVAYARVPLASLEERGVNSLLLKQLMTALPAGAVIAGGYVAALVHGDLANAGDVDIFIVSPNGDQAEGGRVFEETVHALTIGGWVPAKASIDHFDLYKRWLKRSLGLDRDAMVSFEPYPTGPVGSIENKLPVQVIKIAWYKSAEHVIDNFDFTCIQYAIDVGAKELVLNPMAAYDYANHVLVQHRVEPDDHLYKRVAKYALKGFRPTWDI